MSLTEDTIIEWDIGTAYDFFISLSVLHEPEKFGLRGSWAAGVRSRLPAPERDLLQRVIEVIWPLHWVYSLPTPKNVETMLDTLSALPAMERLPALQPVVHEDVSRLWHEVAERGRWLDSELEQLIAFMRAEGWMHGSAASVRKDAIDILDVWADCREVGEGILPAFQCYQDEFFAEEEERIRPALEDALQRGRELAQSLTPPELLEELSQGVRLATQWDFKRTVLAPSFWATPLLILHAIDKEKGIILYGARPPHMSLVPGDVVPDLLYQMLKALADPTRLRILRYLSQEPMTPATLARKLRLRAPTVIHHLDALRLARLVGVTLDDAGKRYTIREGGVESVTNLLTEFLEAREDS